MQINYDFTIEIRGGICATIEFAFIEPVSPVSVLLDESMFTFTFTKILAIIVYTVFRDIHKCIFVFLLLRLKCSPFFFFSQSSLSQIDQ